MHILEDENHRFGARQLGCVDQPGQPAPARVRVDPGQLGTRSGDAQQIVEQQQIRQLGVGHSVSNPRPRRLIVEPTGLADGPQQTHHHPERDVGGVRLTVGVHHGDPTTFRQADGLADES